MSNFIAKEYKRFEDIKQIHYVVEYWSVKESVAVLNYSNMANNNKQALRYFSPEYFLIEGREQ